MEIMKKFFVLLISMTMFLTLFSCGDKPCETHKDDDGDGKCDVCGETVEKDDPTPAGGLALIKDGKAQFKVVVGSNLTGSSLRLVDTMIKDLKDLGIEVEKVSDTESTVSEVEVLIGDVTSRGDQYKYDRYSLGEKGYVCKVVGTKVIIHGGSDLKLDSAIEHFTKNILGLKDGTQSLTNVTMTNEMNVEEIQDDYRITSISVGGVDLKGYNIAAETTNTMVSSFAKTLQSTLYSRAGYYLNIVPLSSAGDKSIIIRTTDDAGEDGFRCYVNDKGAFIIECAYINAFEEAFNEFMTKKITIADGDVNFKGEVFTKQVSIVFYDDFGAKGDGLTDDFLAIKACHDYANKGGQKVL